MVRLSSDREIEALKDVRNKSLQDSKASFLFLNYLLACIDSHYDRCCTEVL